MTASRNLGRLRSIREAEEGQSRALMESVLGELRRMESALKSTEKRRQGARVLMATSVNTGEWIDRIAAMEELAMTERLASALVARIEATEKQAERIRQEFVAKRIERRQVETLLHAANAQEAIETKRKSQAAMDEWHCAQRRANIKIATTDENPQI